MSGGLAKLTAEFGRRFWFTSTRMRDHTSLTAVRRDPSEPGITCVITPDAKEMAEVLREDEAGGDPRAAPRLASQAARRAAEIRSPPRWIFP